MVVRSHGLRPEQIESLILPGLHAARAGVIPFTGPDRLDSSNLAAPKCINTDKSHFNWMILQMLSSWEKLGIDPF
jgi:hypothetical protein